MLQDLARESRRLGVVPVLIDPMPPPDAMPAAGRPATIVPEPGGAARVIPGLTAIGQAPVLRPRTTASSSTATTTATSTAHRGSAFHAPKKVARRGRAATKDVAVKPAMQVAARTTAPGEPSAWQEIKTRKGQPAKMRKARTPPANAPPERRYTGLCMAIKQGSTEQVRALMAQTTAWPHGAITGLLAQLMRDLEWVDTGMLTALVAFFSNVLRAEPATGRAALTVYFAAHPPQFDGLQKLLEKSRLLPTLKAFDTPGKLLHSIASSRDRAFWLPAMMTPGLLEPECTTETGATLLHLAARHGHAELVELLLAVVPEQASAADKNGCNALMLAAERGHMAVLGLLVATPSAAAQASAWDQGGSNALQRPGPPHRRARPAGKGGPRTSSPSRPETRRSLPCSRGCRLARNERIRFMLISPGS
jgi:hypothetical protein